MTKRQVDVHIQKRDYGYMLCNRTFTTTKKAINEAIARWKSLMHESSKTNEITRERLTNGYFDGYPFKITIMPKDAMKGTVMFNDFGKLPQYAKTLTVMQP